MRDERSASDLDAAILVVSQFTLYGDARKGRRPTWHAAAPRDVSEPAYDAFCAELERLGATVARGVFGGDMRVASVNDGPSRCSWRRRSVARHGPADGGGGHPDHDDVPDAAGLAGHNPLTGRQVVTITTTTG